MSLHPWQFFVAGGVNQVRLRTTEDLRALRGLDPTLWAAIGCPVSGHAMDERTMALVDTDHDGRVRVPEILGAVDFLLGALRNAGEILEDPKSLPLAAMRDDTPAAKTLLAAARLVLVARGKAEAREIVLDDVADTASIYTKMPLNGDGVVHAGATTDAALQALIADIVATLGGEADRSGEPGVNAAKVDAFFAACAEFAAWSARAESERATLFPAGDGTDAALAATEAVKAKIDDFYARCRVAAFDARRLPGLDGTDFEPGAVQIDGACSSYAEQPLARVAPNAAVEVSMVNPAWADRVAAFWTAAVEPLLGPTAALSAGDWTRLQAILSPAATFRASACGGTVAALGAARVNALLASDLQARLQALVAADEAQRPEAEALGQLEQLIRYYLHLGCLLRNYVNFAGFYGRTEKAIFQAGTVYFDQRRCDLVLRVQDPGRHAAMAGLAGAYLAYVDCVRTSDGKQLTVCVAVTDGDSDNLMVGRNGLFYDREGLDYDARITKIVDNPISLRQAFWSPYKKFVRMVEDLLAKRAAAADADSSAMVGSAAEATASADKAAPAPAKPIDVGTVAAIGVAVGGISAAIGALLQAFFGLGMWMPIGILGLVLLISGPSVTIAAFTLRRRNLGPLLDAEGWAVNAQARINIPFGRSLTSLAALPPGSSRDLNDPFAQPKSRWPYVAAFVLVALAAAFTALVLTDNVAFLLR